MHGNANLNSLARAGGEPTDPCAIGEGLRAAFEAAPIGIVLAGDEGAIVSANQRACRMFGHPAEALVGKPVEILLPERHRHAHIAQRSGYLAAPVAKAMGSGRELTGLRSDGREFPVEIGIGTWREGGRMLTCVTLVDQTERCRADLLLRNANARLEEFAYVASHDLRSPLRGMAIILESLREGLAGGGAAMPPDIARDLDRLDERITGMAGLIEDLLDFARSTGGARLPETIHLADLVAEVLALQDLPEGMVLSTDLPDVPLTTPRIPLATVIRNLVSNAVKHHDRASGHIRLEARFDGGMCVIDVSDDGPGIPEHARQRIFRLFKTVGAKMPGSTGMGLTVALQLAILHGGSITVHDRAGGRGTCMRVTWPRFARTDHEA